MNNPVMMVDPNGEFAWLAGLLFGYKGYQGYKQGKKQGLDEFGSFVMGFLNVAKAGMAYYAGSGLGDFSTIVGTVASSSINSNGYNVSLGFGGFDLNSGKFSWANPFDINDTFINNVVDAMAWIGATQDFIKAEYYLTTVKAQREEYAKIKADLKLDRDPLDPFTQQARKPAKHGPGFSWWKPWNWLKMIVYKRGNHKENIRYPGGLHWAQDVDKYDNIIFEGFHYDAVDATSLLGFGFIFHGLLEVYPDQIGYGNFLRAVQPYSSTLYKNRYLYMNY